MHMLRSLKHDSVTYVVLPAQIHHHTPARLNTEEANTTASTVTANCNSCKRCRRHNVISVAQNKISMRLELRPVGLLSYHVRNVLACGNIRKPNYLVLNTLLKAEGNEL